MTGLPPSNGHYRQESGHSRKRTLVEMSDDDQDGLGSSHLGKPISMNGDMNGHKPNKKAKKASMNGNSGTLNHNIELQKQRVQLPIHSGKEALVREIRENDVTVLLGETGSGKTTQVPQYLLEAGLASQGMIACTQPRRVAAISLASRVATEQSRPLGSSVGYQVRFDEKTSENTRIKYVTDGMLVRELLGDPLLSRYSIIIVDEAHERTLRTDILISNLKEIIKKRNAPSLDNGKGKAKDTSNPLKVILMSATLDAEKFSKFFDNAKVLYIKGRQHPVKIYHTASDIPDYVDAACRTFFQIHIDQPPGDVLIFMPGQEDIESLENTIKIFAKQLPATSPLVHTCLLYAALSPAQQYKAFQPVPEGTRKCIIATNIAETSITVPGVKYVIDSGKFKEKNYIVAKNGHLGFDALMTRDVTKSSALQRAGRAGREGPGACFRLFTEQAFDALPVSAEPEIRRCSLTSSMLEMKCLGMDMDQVEFMDPPDWMAITSAMKTLVFIGAFDLRNQLTPLGAQMAKFPLEPAHACAVLTARAYGPAVLSSVISIVSILSCTSKLFLDPSDPAAREEASEARKKFRHPSGDHLTRLNALNAYIEAATAGSKNERKRWCKDNFVNERTCVEAINIREQVTRVAGKLKIQSDHGANDNGGGQSQVEEGVLRSLTAGYATNTAFLQPDGTYKQLIGLSIIKIHPSSVLSDKKVPAIIYDELTHTTQIYARGVSSVMRRYIAELPGFRQKIS